MRYVVTGGAGAIGSRLVHRLLLEESARVLVLDDLSSGFAWLLPQRDERLKFQILDVASDLLPVWDYDEPPTAVFHLAAHFANENSVDHPETDLLTNGMGTLRVLRWAENIGARVLVYASAGCSIAGHGVEEPIREDMPVSLDLDTPYQITKALGEFYCSYYHRRGQLKVVRARFFNSFGPGEVPGTYRNVIPNFIWAALHDHPLTVTGTGTETRDWIYVDDIVEGLVRCASEAPAAGEAFNLGTGHETSVAEVARTILDVTRSSSQTVYRPRRAWDLSLRRSAETGKAARLLGFRASPRILEGIQATVAWFRNNQEQIEQSVAPRYALPVAP